VLPQAVPKPSLRAASPPSNWENWVSSRRICAACVSQPPISSTAVLVVTEFGRTAHINGTGGTDHGTAGVAFLLGGAVTGGRVSATWPGLGAGRLFENRDLAPTTDMRSIIKGVLIDHLLLPQSHLAGVLPGSAEAAPLSGLIRT
jgi:uncharacterized protein (DUF1501 family)